MDQLFPRPVQIVVNDEVEETNEENNNLNTQENGEER
jgi:hypothetical protein